MSRHPVRLLAIFECGDYDGADGLEAQFAADALIVQWVGGKGPNNFTAAQLKHHLMTEKITGKPVYSHVQRHTGPGFFVEQHQVSFPAGHKSLRKMTTEAVLCFRLDDDGRIARLDEFLHAKQVAFTPRL